MKNIISTSRVIQAGDCDLYFCCIHSTQYTDGRSIMDATIIDADRKQDPERVTIIREDPQWRAEALARTIEELHGFHYVLLRDDGVLDDCGGLAGTCPCGEEEC